MANAVVDVPASLSNNDSGSLMGRTKGALRSMRTALGGGGEYLQDLSNRIGTALTTSLDESEDTSTLPQFFEDDISQAFSLNQQKSRRRTQPSFHETQHKRLASSLSTEEYEALTRHKLEKQGSLSRALKKYPPGMTYEEINSSRSSAAPKDDNKLIKDDDTSPDRDSVLSVEPIQEEDLKATGPDPYDKLKIARAANRYQAIVLRLDIQYSSGSTSDQDGYGPSTSIDSNLDGRKMCYRSGSSGSIQSWASSLSADSQSEEAAVDFMKSFVALLFESPNTIEQEQKFNFGQMVLTENGRIWFARVVNARRARACVSEETFYSLAQHFAVTLFECHEADDFAPAKSLMNMCFTFYHEVEMPGQESCREYLYANLKDQPIWTSMRFWTAAFFDALQCERATRPVPPRPKSLDQQALAIEDKAFQANIVFGLLGSFTCNMHAFGLPKDSCVGFFKKQCVIANLSKEQNKMLLDNVNRLYNESELQR